jgi:PqqD family protein of HPr-rel-A system
VRHARAPGVRVEPIGAGWAAFSAVSGETLLLNDEAAAILEILAERHALDSEQVCAELARDVGLDPRVVAERIGDSWVQLASAGLIVAVPEPGAPQR